uniref:Uncharacterized protein n=1 Tax=Meloidogyne floridensis TaxID=298350 RepID=A0A915ND39_9BILA
MSTKLSKLIQLFLFFVFIIEIVNCGNCGCGGDVLDDDNDGEDVGAEPSFGQHQQAVQHFDPNQVNFSLNVPDSVFEGVGLGSRLRYQIQIWLSLSSRPSTWLFLNSECSSKDTNCYFFEITLLRLYNGTRNLSHKHAFEEGLNKEGDEGEGNANDNNQIHAAPDFEFVPHGNEEEEEDDNEIHDVPEDFEFFANQGEQNLPAILQHLAAEVEGFDEVTTGGTTPGLTPQGGSTRGSTTNEDNNFNFPPLFANIIPDFDQGDDTTTTSLSTGPPRSSDSF